MAILFTRDDVRWLSETVGAVYGARNALDLARAARAALDTKFNLHSYACEEIGAGGSSYRAYDLRLGAKAPTDYAVCFHDNPFGWVLGSPQVPPVLHMRTDVAYARWQQTDHFNGIARPMGWNDQMVVVAQTGASLVSVGLYRDTVFSERERELARLLQPHLVAAWARVRSPLSDALSESASVALTPALRPLGLTPVQRGILQTYFPRWTKGDELPAELGAWARATAGELARETPPHPLRAFSVESVRGRLLVRLFPAATGVPAHLLLVETPVVPSFLALRRIGLTTRECEVLHWVAEGKRDAEIGAILGCSRATVSKHVENLLHKIGVENRAAAVSAARAQLDRMI